MKKPDGIPLEALVLAIMVLGLAAGWWFYSSHKADVPAAATSKPVVIENGPATESQTTTLETRSPVPSQEGVKGGWVAEDVKIANIGLDMSVEGVLSALGEPVGKEQKTETSPNNDQYDVYFDIWQYSGLQVAFTDYGPKGEQKQSWQWAVYSILVTSGDYPTSRGVQVGDPEEKIVEAYGAPRQPGVYSYEEGNLGFIYHALDFTVSNGVVKEIYLWTPFN